VVDLDLFLLKQDGGGGGGGGVFVLRAAIHDCAHAYLCRFCLYADFFFLHCVECFFFCVCVCTGNQM
jgi:hypothetical protein